MLILLVFFPSSWVLDKNLVTFEKGLEQVLCKSHLKNLVCFIRFSYFRRVWEHLKEPLQTASPGGGSKIHCLFTDINGSLALSHSKMVSTHMSYTLNS